MLDVSAYRSPMREHAAYDLLGISGRHRAVFADCASSGGAHRPRRTATGLSRKHAPICLFSAGSSNLLV